MKKLMFPLAFTVLVAGALVTLPQKAGAQVTWQDLVFRYLGE